MSLPYGVRIFDACDRRKERWLFVIDFVIGLLKFHATLDPHNQVKWNVSRISHVLSRIIINEFKPTFRKIMLV
jgi:hypothetical protein